MSNSKTEKWDIVWIKISTNKLVKEYRVIKSLTTLYIIGKSLPSLHQHCPFCEEESVQNMDILDLLLDLHPGRMTVEWSHTLTWWTLGQDWCFLSLSGQVKHFTVTELYLPLKSYSTAWIRQPAGKNLEWIGQQCHGCTPAYKDSLKNKFSISTDSSSNTVTLNGQNVQPDDTAVYYCARYPH